MTRSAALFGLLGLLFLAFGFVGTAFLAPVDPFVLVNVIAGAALLVAYLAFGFESFRALVGERSTRYGASAALYSLLFVALIGMLNYLGARYHHRWDLTEAGVYTLSPQSKKVVEALPDTLKMTAFVEGGRNAAIESLLDSYRYANPAKVEVAFLDPDREPALAEQMKITTLPSVHLAVGGETFTVTQPSEETVTNGIIRVSRSGKKIVYFTEGFGEPPLDNAEDPKGFSALKLALEQENYEVKPLVLPAVESIPEDANAVVLAGPTRPLTDAAATALDRYLERGGHLLVMVGPGQGGERLRQVLARWGVALGSDIVIDRELRLFEGPRLGVIPLARSYGVHPITQGFRDFTIYPQTSSVSPATDGKTGLTATTLVSTSPTSWAETDLEGVLRRGVATLDESDKKGPVSIAVAVTAKLGEMGLTPPAGVTEARLVVFGTPLFASNQELIQARLNADLFLNAAGWLVGQEELVSIRSRSVRASRAELTQAQATRVFYLSVLIIPELLIAVGIWNWWRRRAA